MSHGQPLNLHSPSSQLSSSPEMQESRRRFLRWLVHGLNTLVGVVLGFPVVCYLLGGRQRSGDSQGYRRVARLSDILRGGQISRSTGKRIYEVAVRDTRRDAWMIYPNEILGRVWLVYDPKAALPADDQQAFEPGEALKAFTSVCPHLGCSISYHAESDRFLCPCHTGTFDVTGQRVSGPPPRPMDWLEVRLVRDPESPRHNPDYFVEVRYQTFWPEKAERIPKT